MLGELFYGEMFGSMKAGRDISGSSDAVDSLIFALTIGGVLPSYLTTIYLLFTTSISPSVRGALDAVNKIKEASHAAVKKRKHEYESHFSSDIPHYQVLFHTAPVFHIITL